MFKILLSDSWVFGLDLAHSEKIGNLSRINRDKLLGLLNIR